MSALKAIPVGDLVESVMTWNPLRVPHQEVFNYIDLSAVDQTTKSILGAREITCGEAPSRARQLVLTGDILVSTVRPNLNGVAKVNSDLDGATASTGFCVLRPQVGRMSSSYLFHWVKSPQFVADMVTKATGASYPAVSDRIIFESLIPAPPLPEQRRIAAILDQADALRAKRREALAQLDSLTQSIFIEMFGDPVSNPKNWMTLPFSEACETRLGKMNKARVRSSFNQQQNAVEWNHQHIQDEFGLEVLRFFKPTIVAWGASTTLPILKKSSFEKIEVPVPPVEMQQKFCEIVASVAQTRRHYKRHAFEADALFNSLQSRAFTGVL